ncbi:hypothetical protein D3C74_50340 [compost metagenome]
MAKVDIKQSVVSTDQVKTDIQVEYARTVETDGVRFTCIVRLSNGFEGVGSIEKKYSSTLTDDQAKALAYERALNFVHMHGYELA